MQIQSITENIKAQEAASGTKVQIQGGETVGKTTGSDFLREINIDQPFYNKSIKDTTEFDALTEGGMASVDAAQLMKNAMIASINNLTDVDLEEMDKEGFRAKDLDYRDFQNIADKIKLQLAKAGKDIDVMGGLSKDQIAAISGSDSYAEIMTAALTNSDLPVSSENKEEGVIALNMAEGIQEKAGQGLSRDAMKYMLLNGLEPTINNIYQAIYSTGMQEEQTVDAVLPEEIAASVRKVITEQGMEVDEAQLQKAAWMLENDIPITGDTVSKLDLLESFRGDFSQDELLESMMTAVEEGNSPKDAYLIEGYSLLDQAKAALDVIDLVGDEEVDAVVAAGEPLTIQNLANHYVGRAEQNLSAEEHLGRAEHNTTAEKTYQEVNISVSVSVEIQLQQVNARKQLEELRLSMTLEASYTMMKNGIDVSTTEIGDLLDELKAMEESLMKQLVGENGDATQMESAKDLFQQVLTTTTAMADLPAMLLGRIPDIREASWGGIYEKSAAVISDGSMQKMMASERYETMMTEVRSDLGDSIKKAFYNSTDAILDELQMEHSEMNARAVRILGYNQMEVTKDNLLEMREVDELVQKTFKSLTPATVTEMIREGFNPLDSTMEEIQEKVEEIQSNDIAKADEERFSKYLLRMDHMKAMTPEERDSFLGIYRLMHQVNQTDGAAIGMLLQQGSEVTMRNLMTAVRSGKHENQEFVIGDDTEYLGGFQKESLSITDQIEYVFQAMRMQDAEIAAMPDKFAAIGENQYMEMSPDQLASALEAMPEDDETRAEVLAARRRELQEAAQAEASVYEALDRFDLPVSPANLQAMTALYADRNVFKNILKEPHVNNDGSIVDINDIDLNALMEESLEDYGEAIKTPEEMAEAQRNLEKIAENILRNEALENGTASIDLKAMQLRAQQMNLFAGMAKQETYHIPIMVADENGTMSLKIVRGTETKGLVDIAYSNSIVGRIQASMKYEDGEVTGTIQTDSEATRLALSENAAILAERISEEAGVRVSFSFAWQQTLNLNDFYQESEEELELKAEITEKDQDAVSMDNHVKTRTLYSIARAFVQGLSELA